MDNEQNEQNEPETVAQSELATVAQLLTQIESLEARIGSRLTALSEKLDGLGRQLTSIGGAVRAHDDAIVEHAGKISGLENVNPAPNESGAVAGDLSATIGRINSTLARAGDAWNLHTLITAFKDGRHERN